MEACAEPLPGALIYPSGSQALLARRFSSLAIGHALVAETAKAKRQRCRPQLSHFDLSSSCSGLACIMRPRYFVGVFVVTVVLWPSRLLTPTGRGAPRHFLASSADLNAMMCNDILLAALLRSGFAMLTFETMNLSAELSQDVRQSRVSRSLEFGLSTACLS